MDNLVVLIGVAYIIAGIYSIFLSRGSSVWTFISFLVVATGAVIVLWEFGFIPVSG